ncbi:DinB family protein [Radiobacillus kanasensis]|uniref:DinB family protein n=1 Tax=Radiobacillus kanasensis TaxID=2844358 RepID=UPI001E5D24DC|nr:DinB family protein [Radiobacillus kanasensis]UFT99610.1 DinB family protein [Radiobacillus kanasensis]
MNSFVHHALHQINIAVDTTSQMLDKLEEQDLKIRPTESKFSVGELAAHLSMICEADFQISNGASSEEMDTFYNRAEPTTIKDIKDTLLHSYDVLKKGYENLSESRLQEEVTSHWGVTYTRYEWLLEIIAHLYHHRGQLHAMLVHHLSKDPGIPLFE